MPINEEKKFVEVKRTIAYLSMEIGIDQEVPTYSGGLGILAGDTIRSAADLRVPMVAVTLLHRKGYFNQKLDPNGWQSEKPVEWKVENHLQEMGPRVFVKIEGRTVLIRVWKYDVVGVDGFIVPIYFLDTDLEQNSEWDRGLTYYLYGGDLKYRLCQEVILGMGGVKMIRSLGYDKIDRFHMNEGHASLLTIELLDEKTKHEGKKNVHFEDLDAIRKRCVFTTHTPVPAGHDQFPIELVESVLGRHEVFNMTDICRNNGHLNMTHLALNLSRYVNGVAKKHGEVSREMFPHHPVESITNGVHAPTWTSEPFRRLFDQYIPDWRKDTQSLRHALNIPKAEIWDAHVHAKTTLLNYVKQTVNMEFDKEIFTIGFARRAATYKRADLLFTDIERLKEIVAKAGSLQIVYAGKAHPHDYNGKELIHRIFEAKESLKNAIKVVYLENYNMELGKLITSGVDVWLNNPQPPLEASGTSGMKAALNGIPSFSILDGWWIEGHIEGVTGWSIGNYVPKLSENYDGSKDAQILYEKLEKVILPLYYYDRDKFIDIMVHCIAINGSFFNTNRMVQEYVLNAYFR